MKKNDIHIRDPFVLKDDQTNNYYMYGTSPNRNLKGGKRGFDMYESKDLIDFKGPFVVFEEGNDFWADEDFWAPEVHFYNDAYYMLASFKRKDICRGTQIFKAETPFGPFIPMTKHSITPSDWGGLDGTFYVDDENNPWIIFCKEWIQIKNGEMYAMRLSNDLKEATSEPYLLFDAKSAPWSKGLFAKFRFNYITDGPFIYKNERNELLMLWSSFGKKGYTQAISVSKTGCITGPWIHLSEPLYIDDGGHGMVFKTFDQKLMLTLHASNKYPNERAKFIEIIEIEGQLKVLL